MRRIQAFLTKLLRFPPLGRIEEISIASICIGTAVLARIPLEAIFPERLPYLTFFPAIASIAVLCGFKVTWLSAFLSAGLGTIWIEAPPGSATVFYVSGPILFLLASAIAILPIRGLKEAHEQIRERDMTLVRLNRELGHRIGNVFQIALSVVSSSMRYSTSMKEAEAAITGRFRALGAAQRLSVYGDSPVSLTGLIDAVVRPLAPDYSRLNLAGDSAQLEGDKLNSLALVLYELGTNCLKYGAWSDERGLVFIEWNSYAGKLLLIWREAGGPPVEKPGRLGSGSELIEHAIPGARVKWSLDPAGVRCMIEIASPANWTVARTHASPMFGNFEGNACGP